MADDKWESGAELCMGSCNRCRALCLSQAAPTMNAFNNRAAEQAGGQEANADTQELEIMAFDFLLKNNFPDKFIRCHAEDKGDPISRIMAGFVRELERASGVQPAPDEQICGQRERDAELLRVVNDPEIVYYGPHLCECGATICRVSLEQGGMKFIYPEGIIYPNTNWVQHVCDGSLARASLAPGPRGSNVAQG